MRALFLLRFDAGQKGGGDVIQINKYAGFVRGSGGDASFSSSLQPDASGYDLVHACNIDRPETYFQVRSVAKHFPHIPILLTPIHHSNVQRREYERHGRRGALRMVNALVPGYQFREALKFLIRGLRSRALLPAALHFLAVTNPQRKIAAAASVHLFASEAERSWCNEDYHIKSARHEIFPNGIEEVGAYSLKESRDIDVIMTGRVESRKNQVAVLKALAGTGLKVCVVGAENQSHQRYVSEFKALLAANPSFDYLGVRPHAETLTLMSRSRVYISASWLEVMSLSDIEAFGAGCRVIASRHGSTHEVLGDLIRYVRPGAAEDIRTALNEELSKQDPIDVQSRHTILKKYLWSNLGEQLLTTYRRELVK